MFNKAINFFKNNQALTFIIFFLSLYCLFKYGNEFFYSVMLPQGRYYNEFISKHLNYIQVLRSTLIVSTCFLMELLGYTMLYSQTQLLALNGLTSNINYSCLGLGVFSFWAAFVIAYPKPIKQKIRFFFIGFFAILGLNIFRLVILTILTVEIPEDYKYFSYQHDAFNFFVYTVLFTMIYFWVKNKNLESPISSTL